MLISRPKTHTEFVCEIVQKPMGLDSNGIPVLYLDFEFVEFFKRASSKLTLSVSR